MIPTLDFHKLHINKISFLVMKGIPLPLLFLSHCINRHLLDKAPCRNQPEP